MHKLLQVIFGLIERYDKSLETVIYRKIWKETGLLRLQLEYLVNDL